MKSNPLCSLLGIQYPVLQGAMAWIADAKLAAAVSNAGGLGIIAAMNSTSEQLRMQIRKARSLTDKPFGVNIMLMSPHAAEVARTVCEECVPIITTGAGNPAVYMKDWLAAGIKVIPVVPSSGLARMVERRGACAVVAEGCEAGGHIGELTTMALIPQVCDAVDIPVIAAGGIADGRGAAAAFMLGAAGIQMGTRFLTVKECGVHPDYKKRVLDARDIDTIVTGRRLGHPVRSLKTAFSREMASLEYRNDITNDQLEEMGAGSLRKAAIDGDFVGGSVMAGQISGIVCNEPTCDELIPKIISDAKKIISEFSNSQCSDM